jgi:hypothetical protein
MTDQREMKRAILRDCAQWLATSRDGYTERGRKACDVLIAEFGRRARLLPDGPPPGHPQLPGLEAPMAIKTGDTIRHESLPEGVADVTVLAVRDCVDDNTAPHPAYLINDPESGEPDVVCSREFVLVRLA